MKFALINSIKVEATKGSIGICPNCNGKLIAKCGEQKIHHWAHSAIRNCDPWWENETQWHRSWKNNYSEAWQEISLRDKVTNETHIADVLTNNGLVIEFQHSPINPNERIAREKFYKNLVWVIDGTRLKGDYNRFVKGSKNFRRSDDPQIFYFDIHDQCFPAPWLKSPIPVIFDFKGIETIDDPEDPRNYLYCLQPKIDCKYPLLARITRQSFISSTTSGVWLSMVKNYFSRPNLYQQLKHAYAIKNFGVKTDSPYIFEKGRFIKRRRL